MSKLIVNFASLLLSSLVVGAMFGIWLVGNPVSLTASAYVQQQQNAIRGLNVALPILGLTSALLTLTLAILTRSDRRRAAIFAVAFACLMAAGLITRLLNQPINATVMTWSGESPPAEWGVLRDEWWQWHQVRTGLGVTGLGLLILASLLRPRAPE